MTVKTLVTIYKRRLRNRAAKSPLALGGDFDKIVDGYAFSAIKYLANDGFIKLSKAASFENREVFQYHATAEPEFRSGKFRV